MDAALRVLIPGELSPDGKDFTAETEMKAGEYLGWGQEEICGGEAENEDSSEALCHEAARTHRRVFLGADENTAFFQAVDGFTCAFLMGNELYYQRTPYVFDFGCTDTAKNYDNAYPVQFVLSGQGILYTGGPRKVGTETWDSHLRFGFTEKRKLSAVDRHAPDDLRRDFVEGTEESVFSLYLPRGKYDFLIISGDEEEESSAVFDLPDYGCRASTGRLKKGRYACKVLSALAERDGEVKLRIRPGDSGKWKLNGMFVNKSNFF